MNFFRCFCGFIEKGLKIGQIATKGFFYFFCMFSILWTSNKKCVEVSGEGGGGGGGIQTQILTYSSFINKYISR